MANGKSLGEGWLFWSTRESIRKGIPSITAILETLSAVLLYWWIAIRFETYLLLLIGAAVAPLVLLRSEPSTKLGLKWFKQWENRDSNFSLPYGVLGRGKAMAMWFLKDAAVAGAVFTSYHLVENFVAGSHGWNSFVRSLEIGWLPGAIAGALVLAAFTVLAGPGPAAGAGAVVRIIGRPTRRRQRLRGKENSLFASLAVMISWLATIFFAWQAAGGLSVLGVIASSFLMGPTSMIGVLLGVLILSIGIRLAASIVYLKNGVRELPNNFRRLTICTSPLQEPDLVPDLSSEETLFTVGNIALLLRQKFSHGPVMVFYALALLVWFIPGWLYRLTIKSTAWFWWPLAFLGGDLRKAKYPELFRIKLIETLWAKVSIAVAAGTLLTFVITSIVATGTTFTSNPFLTMWGFLFIVDWSFRPWQLLSATAAMLTILILFLADGLSREYRFASENQDTRLLQTAEVRFGWIERLARFRLLLVVAFWFIVGVHTGLYFNSLKCWVAIPENLNRWATSIYGDRLPQTHCFQAR